MHPVPVAPEGLSILWSCPEPQADIVLIHGIQGHPKKTWMYTRAPGIPRLFNRRPDGLVTCYWPEDLLPQDFPACRILTYGYDSTVSHFFSGAANQTNILGHAKTFLNEFEEQRRGASSRPVVFIAHSLGGLLLKAVLRQAAESDIKTADGRVIHEICKFTVGIIFLGTPHRGSMYAGLAELAAGVAEVASFDTSTNILKDLRVDSSILEVLEDSFSKLYSTYRFTVFTFEESQGLKIPFRGRRKVVESWSAHLGYPGEEKGVINADHRSMCRFSGHDSPGYGQVRRAVEICFRRRFDEPPTDTGRQIESPQRQSENENRLTRRIEALLEATSNLMLIAQQFQELGGTKEQPGPQSIARYWRCRVLNNTCSSNHKCPGCKINSLHYQPSTNISLQHLESHIIPAFFSPGELRKFQPPSWPIPRSALRGAVIQACCSDIELTMPIGSSYGDIESMFTNAVSGAALEFQLSFPDREGFRVALVDQCLQLRNSFPETAKALDLGLSFLMLALIISHPVEYSISGSELGDFYFHPDLNYVVNYHIRLCIHVLLQRTLRKLLSVIENHFNDPNRDDWLPICFALCLLFMGAESLQVDIYLVEREPLKTITAMEENAVKTLVEAFFISTNRVDPLIIDWNDQSNAELIGSDADLVYAFQDLQDLRNEYSTFLNARRRIRFTREDADCLTGKLVSSLLLMSDKESEGPDERSLDPTNGL